MYGLPADTDLSFLEGALLTQVCAGENEVILHFDRSISITIEGAIRAVEPDGAVLCLEEPRAIASSVLPFLGSSIVETSVLPPGTLRVRWSSESVLEVLDSSDEYESYSIKAGDTLIVV